MRTRNVCTTRATRGIAAALVAAQAFLIASSHAQVGPPQNVRVLQLGPYPQRIAFRWDAPATGTAVHYQVYLNDSFQATASGTSWVDSRLLPGTQYCLSVRAVDSAGGVSAADSVTTNTFPIPPLQTSYVWNTICLNYADYTNTPFLTTNVHAWIYGPTGSVDSYFREVSYDGTSIGGSVFGWYTLPGVASNYHTRGTNNGLWWGPISSKIREDMLTVVPPEAVSNTVGQILILHGTGDAGVAAGLVKMISSRLTNKMPEAIIHELGHSISVTDHYLGHPGGWLSPDAPVGPSLLKPQAGGCQAYIYGYDPFDPMGSGTRHFMSYNKWHLGMIGPHQVTNAEEGVEYDIEALAATGGLKMIKIPLDGGYFYFAEYRKPIGLDGTDLFQGSNHGKAPIDGVLVRIRMVGQSPYTTLLAYPPGSTAAPLVCNPGQPFEDPYRGIRIEVVSKTGTTARVKFDYLPTVPLQITDLQYSGSSNRFDFSWTSETGATYLIERSFDLTGPDWITLNEGYPFAPYPTNGATGSLTTTSCDIKSPRAFYRLRRR